MQSNEQKLRMALRIAVSYIDMDVLYTFRGEEHDLLKEALALPTDDVKSVLQDAQRYRWLREQHWSNNTICCVTKPKQNVRLGGTCPSGDLLDDSIDATMRKEHS